MRTNLLVMLALLVATPAVAKKRVPVPPPAPVVDSQCTGPCAVQKLLEQNVGLPLDRPIALADLRKLGKVQSEQTIKTGAMHLSDTIHEFTYQGLIVRVEVTAENTVLVQTIDLTGGKWRLPFNIKLGKVEGHDVDAVLGPPAETKRPAGKPMIWIYHNLEGTARVGFERTDDTIIGVHWDFTGGD